MTNRIILSIITLTFTVAVSAQRKGVIISAENGLPVRDVVIYTNNNETVTTNWLGEFFIPFKAKSFTTSHGKYLPITVDIDEMTDTIHILPRMHSLGEVIVWGKKPELMGGSPIIKKEDAKLAAPHTSGFTFDFFSLFQRPKMSRKLREKHKEIIENY